MCSFRSGVTFTFSSADIRYVYLKPTFQIFSCLYNPQPIAWYSCELSICLISTNEEISDIQRSTSTVNLVGWYRVSGLTKHGRHQTDGKCCNWWCVYLWRCNEKYNRSLGYVNHNNIASCHLESQFTIILAIVLSHHGSTQDHRDTTPHWNS